MGAVKDSLLIRSGRGQFGSTDDDFAELRRELDRRRALTPAQRKKEDDARQRKMAAEKREAAKRRKAASAEERKKKAEEENRTKEFFASFGIPDWTPTDPHFSMSHAEYLQSPLWRKIRRRVLKRDAGICQTCGAKAVLVHHLSYGYKVICGRQDEDLASLCEGCHREIEFDTDGRHRTVEEKLGIFIERKAGMKPSSLTKRQSQRPQPSRRVLPNEVRNEESDYKK